MCAGACPFCVCAVSRIPKSLPVGRAASIIGMMRYERRETRGTSACKATLIAMAAIVVLPGSGDVYGAAPAPKRARPPKFDKVVNDAFFPDARVKLVGPRPKKVTGEAATSTSDPTTEPSEV